MNGMNGLVAVAEFPDESRAFIAAGMLRNNGIEATVDGSIMTTLYGAGSTWAPVRLYVPAASAATALRLLSEHKD